MEIRRRKKKEKSTNENVKISRSVLVHEQDCESIMTCSKRVFKSTKNSIQLLLDTFITVLVI